MEEEHFPNTLRYLIIPTKPNIVLGDFNFNYQNDLPMMMMMMMMMMNYFCGMIDRRKAFSLISFRDHCQRPSPSWIYDTPRAGFEPAQNLSSGLVELNLCSMKLCSTKLCSMKLCSMKLLMQCFNFEQLVGEPTHVRGGVIDQPCVGKDFSVFSHPKAQVLSVYYSVHNAIEVAKDKLV